MFVKNKTKIDIYIRLSTRIWKINTNFDKNKYCQQSFFNKFCSHFRSSRPEMFCKKGVLRNFPRVTGKHSCQSLFSNEDTSNFIKKETLAQVFSYEFCEMFKNIFLVKHFWWLLLTLQQLRLLILILYTKMSDILYTLIIDYYTSTLSHLLNKMFVSDSAIFTGINETRKSCVALRSWHFCNMNTRVTGTKMLEPSRKNLVLAKRT